MGRRKNRLRNRQEKSENEHNREQSFNSKRIRESIIIACEDSSASHKYFKLIIDDLIQNKKIIQNSIVIVPHDGATDPLGVLNNLKSYKDYEKFDIKWIVIDRDKEIITKKGNRGGHTQSNFNNAIINARKDGSDKINVAYAIDSFELWYLLHFDYINTGLTRNEITTKLISKLKEHDAKTFKDLDKKNIKSKDYTKEIYNYLLPFQDKALRNAKKLLDDHKNPLDDKDNNPSTTVFCLITKLNYFMQEEQGKTDEYHRYCQEICNHYSKN